MKQYYTIKSQRQSCHTANTGHQCSLVSDVYQYRDKSASLQNKHRCHWTYHSVLPGTRPSTSHHHAVSTQHSQEMLTPVSLSTVCRNTVLTKLFIYIPNLGGRSPLPSLQVAPADVRQSNHRLQQFTHHRLQY